MSTPRLLLPALGAILLFAGVTWAALPEETPLEQPPAAVTARVATFAPRYRSVSHTITEGDTGGKVVRALLAEGATGDEGADGLAARIVGAAKGRLDRVYVGDVAWLDYRDGEADPWRFRLDSDDPTEFTLTRTGESWATADRPIPYDISTGRREMTVTSSLWEAALSAGLRPSQIIAVAHIFEYDVDFNTELVKGARILLAADTLVGEDGEARVGNIRGAVLENGSKTYTAIRFTHPDGTVGWYAPDGEGRKRAFLRSPLEFSRVTSGFSTGRYHPVLKIKRPHLGVDFGAPTGTAVRAVADGVVEQAGPAGGHGNFVKLDHEGPYETSYSHLSKILVKRGQKVRQGDVIGRVGSTGLATGPHLHYQFYVNGAYKDPMKVNLPMTQTLGVGDKAAFFAARDAVLPLLADPTPAVADAAE